MKTELEPKDEKCHHLYTLWAFEHINTAVECLEKFDQYSNINVMDLSTPLLIALKKKINTNPAYNEAFGVLCKIQPDRFRFLSEYFEKNVDV